MVPFKKIFLVSHQLLSRLLSNIKVLVKYVSHCSVSHFTIITESSFSFTIVPSLPVAWKFSLFLHFLLGSGLSNGKNLASYIISFMLKLVL